MSDLDASAPHLNATVKASAGVGKTYLLVTRLVRLLLAGAEPDSILAITFTRKAAAEIHTRLAERLFEFVPCDDEQLAKALGNIGVAASATNIQRARNLYERLLRAERPVRTSTFHAFCQDILRRFPLEADVPPGFELLDKAGDYEASAWDAVFDEATRDPGGEPAGHLELLFDRSGGLHGVRTALMAFLQHRSDWWAFTARQPDPVEFAGETLRQQLDIDPDIDPAEHFFNDELNAELLEFARLLARHETKTNLNHADRLAMGLSAEMGLDLAERLAAVRDVFLTGTGTPRARKESKAQAKAMGEDGQARFLELHDKCCAALAALREQQARRATLLTSRAWYAVGARLLEHFQTIKQEQRLLDFADLEWKACQLLTQGDNALWVQYKLDQRIEHLLVDEFQDTNPSQWQLLLPLLEEMAAGETTGRSVFLVGDGKQSIYGFRRADPRLLDAAGDWLAQHLAARNYPLDTSWRSAPAIMDFVNLAFGEGELHRRLPDFHPHRTHLQDLWGRVEMLPLIEPAEDEPLPQRQGLRNPLREPRTVFGDDRHYREGRMIAARISDMLEQPLLIGPAAKARPLHPGDVMLLVRNRTHTRDYEQALREAGIPYQGANRGTLLDSLEIQDMVALLDVLVTPFNNLSLATVLRCPLFACSDADLMRLAGEQGPWIERLAALAPGLDQGTPLARAHHWLSRWRAMAGHIPVHDLLDRIYSEGNLIARYEAAFPAHLRARVRGNLIRFIELALEIDSGRYPSISRFLARLEEWQRSEQDAPDEATANGDDCVRIMTIHGSKGLEAPVVFLAGSTDTGQGNGSYGALVNWPSGEQRPSHLLLVGKKDGQDQVTAALVEDQERRAQQEDANLLYVAVTRARQLLFISGCRPNRGNELGWYGLLANRFSGDEEDAPSFVIETGHMPQVSTTTATTAAPPLEPDPRLAQPLVVESQIVPIAPSQADAEEKPPEDDTQDRGIAIHRFLELLAARPDSGDEMLLHSVAQQLRYEPHAPLLAACLAEARRVVAAPHLSALFDQQRYTTAYNEVPIQYRLNARTVYGIIDRLVVDGDEVVLLDYKTHRHADAGNIAELARQYQQQMWFYAQGVRQLWPEHRLRACLLFTACTLIYELNVEQRGADLDGAVTSQTG